MTQEEWDAATPEKRVLHQFLAAMRECYRPDGTPMRGEEFGRAMRELVGPAAPATSAEPSTDGVRVDGAPSDSERLRVVLATFGKREDNLPLTDAERGLLRAFDDRGAYTDRMKLSAIDEAVRASGVALPSNNQGEKR